MAGEVIATGLYVIVGPSGRIVPRTNAFDEAGAWHGAVLALRALERTLRNNGYRCVPVALVSREEG